MNSIFKKIFFCLIVFCLSRNLAWPYPVTVSDDLRNEVPFSGSPKNIVLLDPVPGEILVSLGVKEKNIVEVTQLDAEKVNAANPDLVISFGAQQEEFARQLQKQGLKVFFAAPQTVDDVCGVIERIAVIFGRPKHAAALISSIKNKIEAISRQISDIPFEQRPDIFVARQLEPLATIGGESYLNDLILQAGGKNAFRDVQYDFFDVSLPEAAERDPDVLVVPGKDLAEVKEKLQKLGWDKLPAFNQGKVLVVPADLLFSPGPRIAELMEKIARFLYPGRFSFKPSQRIVSLSPAVTAYLTKLGQADKIAGRTSYCQMPKDSPAQIVASTVDVSLEKIVQLKPDIVFASELTDPKAVEQLKKLKIKTLVLPEPRDFLELCGQFIEVGQAVGQKDQAQNIADQAKDQVQEISRFVSGLPKPKVFVQVGANPLFTVTKDSFLNDYVACSGGQNIAQDAPSGLYSREAVVSQNPDCILIVTMGIVGQQEKAQWEKIKTLSAVQNNRIFILDSYKVCSPTPETFARTLQEIAEILHPRLGANE